MPEIRDAYDPHWPADPILAETLTEWRTQAEDENAHLATKGTYSFAACRILGLIGEVERLTSALAEAERRRDEARALERAVADVAAKQRLRAEAAEREVQSYRDHPAEDDVLRLVNEREAAVSELAALREGIAGLADEAERGADAWGTCHEEWLRIDRLRALLGDQESDR